MAIVACLSAGAHDKTLWVIRAIRRSTFSPVQAQHTSSVAGIGEVGVVAGTARRGIGRWVAPLQGPNDGTVLVEETQIPGLAAHCTVHCGHTELAFSREAAGRVVQFLSAGSFDDSGLTHLRGAPQKV